MSDVFVLVDGEEGRSVPATDSSVLRGDGCFEAVRSYGGRLFRLDDHLDRLERSASALEIELPDRELVNTWMDRAARSGGDCVVRVVVSRGGAVPGADHGSQCIVIAHPPPQRRDRAKLWPVSAPWHPAGRPWELAGAKTISYAPNLAATRLARRHGADDALLLGEDDVVLEGPTFSVGWVRGDQVFLPPLSLGVLDSITRRVVEEMETTKEEQIAFSDLGQADEVFVMSTTWEVAPVVSVGPLAFEPGPRTRTLAQRFQSLVGQPETGDQPR